MPAINQLSKISDLQKGDQLIVDAPGRSAETYPKKSSLYLLLQYLAGGVFQYLNISDFFRVPGVPFAALPDPVSAGMGARAFCTDAGISPNAFLTVGEDSYIGYSDGAFFGATGSISNNIFTPNGGVISMLIWDNALPDPLFYLALHNEYPNSGWNTITVNGTVFARTDAAYVWDSPLAPGLTIWQWTAVPNPFSAEGQIDDIYYDASSINFNDPANGGGVSAVPVFSDGTIWRIG